MSFAADRPELDAAQDGSLALLLAGAGLLTGLAVVVRGRSTPTATTVLAVAGALLGGAVTAGAGYLLGPPGLAAQGAPGAPGDLFTSPLLPSSPAVLLVWPTITALVATVGHLVRCWTVVGPDGQEPDGQEPDGQEPDGRDPGSGGFGLDDPDVDPTASAAVTPSPAPPPPPR